MQIKKTYKDINPEILYDEAQDLVQKQGVILDKAKLQTYSLSGGSSHVSRGTLIFRTEDKQGECIRVHIVGSSVGETRMMLDIDEGLFTAAKVLALEEDLDFIFGSYEAKQ